MSFRKNYAMFGQTAAQIQAGVPGMPPGTVTGVTGAFPQNVTTVELVDDTYESDVDAHMALMGWLPGDGVREIANPLQLLVGGSAFSVEVVEFATADDEPYVAKTIDVPTTGAATMLVLCTAVQSDGSRRFSQLALTGARRGSGGAAHSGAMPGVVTPLENTFVGQKPSLSFAVTGGSQTITATGKANTDISWTLGIISLSGAAPQ